MGFRKSFIIMKKPNKPNEGPVVRGPLRGSLARFFAVSTGSLCLLKLPCEVSISADVFEKRDSWLHAILQPFFLNPNCFSPALNPKPLHP